jgi:hypothetical protein
MREPVCAAAQHAFVKLGVARGADHQQVGFEG